MAGERVEDEVGGELPKLHDIKPQFVRTDSELVARVALRLLRDPASWVRRRVETITFVGERTIHRQMSVDFVLPAADERDPDDPLRLLAPAAQIWVPLWLPRKETLTNFDVWDEDGRRLTTLNTRENGVLASHALIHLASRRRPLRPAEEEQLERVAAAPAPKALALLQSLKWLDELLPPGSSGRTLIEDLAEAFMLLVPVSYQAGTPRLVKWSVDQTRAWQGVRPEDENRRQRLATWLAWKDKVQRFPDLSIGLAESYHVELAVPDNVQISDAFMVASQWTPDVRGDGLMNASVVRVAEKQRERAHLNTAVKARHGRTEKSKSDRATVVATLRPERDAAFKGLWITTLLMAAMLLLVRCRVGELDNTNAVTLLLAFPALVTAYLARPGEHLLAAHLLRGVRFVALLGVIVGLVGAALLVGGFLRDRTRPIEPGGARCVAVTSFSMSRSPSTRLGPAAYECTNAPAAARVVGPSDLALVIFDLAIATTTACAAVIFLSDRATRYLDSEVEQTRKKLASAEIAQLAL